MTPRRRIVAATLIAVCVAAGSSLVADAASAKTVPVMHFKNCTAMHKVYRHGVGRKGAKDKVRGKTKPVTTFYVNTALYNANTRLDADHDGIACEKA
ncbi:MAG TPA: excalibur calcium-binding domain-containing protein [Kineosporiaceae bacterium]|nr:excalibur calcium-binding domain-containing protein [Kineosporiaceae bacterium]